MIKVFKICNLYCGIGGKRKLWPKTVTIKGITYKIEVTAVENNEEIAKIYCDFFPDDTMIIADAHQYLLDHYKEFDFIWSSPPCPTHSRLSTLLVGRKQIKPRYIDIALYQEIIFLQNWCNAKWVVENVVPYYEPLVSAQKSGNHLFWANFPIVNIKEEPRNTCGLGGLSRFDHLNIDYNILKTVKSVRTDKILQNMVSYELGLHILNQALERIDKTKVTQLSFLV